MFMKAVSTSNVELDEFLEIVIMWHCAGDIPMDRQQTVEFIERYEFADFLQSVQHWATTLGLAVPSRSAVVRALHTLYAHS